ncbi:MAG: hypothetical protein WBV46_00825 [Terriglobales bacterium]|jgi:hypothetical protein
MPDATIAAPENAFRFFHGLADGMKIVTGRDDRKEQDQRATQRADEE